MQTRIDDHNEYQGVPVTPNFKTVLSGCKADALADLHTLEENIKGRLEWSDFPADNEERERETFILDDWDECFDIPL